MATVSDSTRDRIIDAAGQVFAAKGFEIATVREICRLGKANLAAVNYYFGDKRRLYLATVEYAHRQRAEQVPFPDWSLETSPKKKLAEFVLTMITRMIGPGPPQWERELLLREVARPTEACREMVQDFIRPQFAMLGSILAELAPQLDERTRHLFAFSVVGQCLHYKVVDSVVQMLVSSEEFSTYTPELLAGHITRVVLGGLDKALREQGERVAR